MGDYENALEFLEALELDNMESRLDIQDAVKKSYPNAESPIRVTERTTDIGDHGVKIEALTYHKNGDSPWTVIMLENPISTYLELDEFLELSSFGEKLYPDGTAAWFLNKIEENGGIDECAT